jgi:hypothetical protein
MKDENETMITSVIQVYLRGASPRWCTVGSSVGGILHTFVPLYSIYICTTQGYNNDTVHKFV